MRNRNWGFTAAIVLAIGLALSGCAHRQATNAGNEQRKDTTTIVEAHNSEPAPSDKAKIVFVSTGMPTPVIYSVSTSGRSCEGFDSVGNVANNGHGVVLPWIAKMNEKTNRLLKSEVSRTRTVQPDVPLQVRGYSLWTISKNPDVIRENSCGPFETTLIPQKGKTYQVEFSFLGSNRCEQHVTDITNGEASPVPVESVTQSRPACGSTAPKPDVSAFDAIAHETVCRTTLINGPIGQSAELCVSKGFFAHDIYELGVDGVTVAKGIDDETTKGVAGQSHGHAINLTCNPVLDTPTNVTDAQIDSIRFEKPNGTRDELKALYIAVNSTELGRHCKVDAQGTELFSVDVRFP